MESQAQCPCGSERELDTCCLPLIQGKKSASTAEALLRARYTAFTRGDIDFIVDSHHSRTRGEVNRGEIEQWSKESQWLGLQILKMENGAASDDTGAIDFHARYRMDGRLNDHWEHGIFEKENGQWRFLDAQALKNEPIRRDEPKIGRNDPCTCGSGKKYKKCCGTS